MNEEFVKSYSEKMQKSLDVLARDYGAIRAGRANPAVLDRVTVDYYGTPTPITQMAQLSVVEARTLTVQPWDKSTLKAIEKAIQASDVGVNPQNDGTVLRMIFPPLTEERRRELSKQIAKMGEETKVAVRSIRRDANDKLKAQKKASQISEDEIKDTEKRIQEVTDRFCKDVDKMSEAKTKDIMEI